MAESFRLSVVTGDGTVYEGEVESVRIPTGFGSVGVLAHHAPMLCAVEKGILLAQTEGGRLRIRVSGGVANVENNELTVLVSSGEVLEEEKAECSRPRAESRNI